MNLTVGKQKEHVTNVKAIKENKRMLEAANICPKCGGSLIKRQESMVNFMGSNYPKCRSNKVN
ncbi:topoisomerase DNA-binding C4 zinc finger domain-containing protein [Anaerobacillus sp. HL2]|nr:topoisomerase DNA-binding C4 zinc finger domain-containing protein [Anaerobacillus sp. HL2]